jgi:hypothetical protein
MDTNAFRTATIAAMHDDSVNDHLRFAADLLGQALNHQLELDPLSDVTANLRATVRLLQITRDAFDERNAKARSQATDMYCGFGTEPRPPFGLGF